MSTPPPNDHEINRRIRAVLSRHWVDLASTNFASRKGIVRLTGDLKRVGPQAGRPLESTSLTILDSEIRRQKGVQRVHFDLANWRRTEDGEWVRVEKQEHESEDELEEGAPPPDGAEPPPALPSQPDSAQ
jgi:hypothetical protein